MTWIGDSYIVQAADVAALWSGRAWSSDRCVWETVSGKAMEVGRPPPHRRTLRGVDIRAQNALGSIKSGVRIDVYLIGDPMHPELRILPLVARYQSADSLVFWQGSIPMEAGIEWRICKGGLIATDVVGISVCYE